MIVQVTVGNGGSIFSEKMTEDEAMEVVMKMDRGLGFIIKAYDGTYYFNPDNVAYIKVIDDSNDPWSK